MWVTVGNNQSPVADFTFSCTELTCSFDASTSTDDNQITEFQWNFGDNTSGNGITANHSFAQSGNYTVELTVFDEQRAQSSRTRTVNVLAPIDPEPGKSSGGAFMWLSGLLILLSGAIRRKSQTA